MLGTWDTETFELPGGELRDMMVHLEYESGLSGHFNSITFVHTGFQYRLANCIQKSTYVFDYIPKESPNTLINGLLKPQRKQRKKRKKAAAASGLMMMKTIP